MNYFIKTTTILFLMAIIFQSCTSDECEKDIVSDEQKISTDLAEKIIATATSKNDYNFFTNNVNSTSCDFPSTYCYFNNPQGDYYQFTIIVDFFDDWLSEYVEAKLEAFNTTGVEFTDDDFVLAQMDILSGFGGLTTREDFIKYFNSCSDIGSTQEYTIPFLDANSNCNGSRVFLALDGESIVVTDISNLTPIESFLNTVNENNNQNYSLEDILISTIEYEAPNGEQAMLYESEDLINYFDDCLFNRTITYDDCLNFVYPLQVNRFSLQLEEVITTTIENDEDLITTFSIDVGELGFVFPISLIGQDGSMVSIETNEALENALDNSFTYCH